MIEQNFNMLFSKTVEEVKKIKIADKNDLLQDLQKSKARIFRNYEGVNNYAKAEYMKRPINDKHQLLDRHKFVSCFIISFMNELKFEKYRSKSELIRAKISLMLGLSIFKFFVISDDSNYNDAMLTQHLKNNNWKFPPLICDNNEYIKNWASELFFAYNEKRLFVLSLSHELFFLETFNRQLAQANFQEKTNK